MTGRKAPRRTVGSPGPAATTGRPAVTRGADDWWGETTVNDLELLGAAGHDPVELRPYDEAWAAAFTAWRDRLAQVLGPRALRIDHVGSTAVPGLPAKPVVDVQVSVADVDDERSFVPAVESLGLMLRAREPGHRYFREDVGTGATRTVHVHVCTAGQPWEHDHLLFRDYLRAHPEHRDAYAALKHDLAARHRDDRVAYTAGKDSFVAGTLMLADDWAVATQWTP